MIRESKRYTSQISSRIFTIPVIYSGLREWKRTEKPNFRSLRPVKAVGENFEVAYNIQTLVTPRQPYVRLHKQTVNRNNLVPIPICQTDASFRPTRRAKFSLLNARSISNKSTAIREFIANNSVDILALTETWLNQDSQNEYIIRNCTPLNYVFKHVATKSRGGGVALIYKKAFAFKANLLDAV
jgi:hypothetical protein